VLNNLSCDSLVVTSLKNYTVLPVNVYPNPSQSIVSVRADNFIGSSLINIFNIEGKLVYQTQQNTLNNQITIPVTHLSNGQYLIVIKNNQMLYQSKFIKE
jgi:hypothetical protein